jgi:hypothetical protein
VLASFGFHGVDDAGAGSSSALVAVPDPQTETGKKMHAMYSVANNNFRSQI